jgi:hypothetical protein
MVIFDLNVALRLSGVRRVRDEAQPGISREASGTERDEPPPRQTAGN